MPITPTYPGVYIEELPSLVHTIAGVATSITAFVGYTSRGIDNRAEQLLSFSDYERLFGGIDSHSELSYAVQQFFANGGSQAYVVRTPRVGATSASVTFENLVFTALSSGDWANGNLLIDVDQNNVVPATAGVTAFNLTVTNLDDGTVETFPSVSLDPARSNYVLTVVNDPDNGSQLVNFSTPGGLSTTAPPATTGTVGNAITQSTVNTTVGGGATAAVATGNFGIALSIATSPPSPLPLSIRVFSQTGPIPQTVPGLAAQLERAINASLAVNWPGASVRCTAVPVTGGQGIRVVGFLPGHSDAVLTIGAPSGPSGLTDVSGALGLSGLTGNVAHHTLTGGLIGSALPGATQLIGDELTFTGIYALRRVDLFNLLSIPDATRANPSNPAALDTNISAGDVNTIYAAALSLCQERRAMLLVDPPPFVNAVASAVDWKTSGLTVHQENGAAFFPRLRLPDPANYFQPRTFAPSGVVAGLYARIDGTRGVWKAPAGTEAVLTGVQGVVYKLNDLENGVLNPLGLNCFRIFPIYGAVLWGARTLVGSDAEGSQWKYVPVRRVALYIEESLYRGTKWAVFEPNDETLWAQLRLNIGSFMHDLFRRSAFQGQTPSEAYLVKCDKDTTTQSDIDHGIVNILVGFAPLKPAEFVIIQIQQLAGQLQT
jgi:hypothetical protein